MDRIETTPTDEAPSNVNRRSLMGRIGAGAATAVALGAVATGGAALTSAPAQAQALTDADIFNFALNLEYLEAEFYLRAIGQTLPASDITGVGASGGPIVNNGVTGGSAVPFRSPAIQSYAQQIAVDEQAHVRFIRAVLGSAAVARPQIDFTTAFTNLALAAGLIVQGQTFSPFADDVSFLLGAFVFEDVGVTAYGGANRFISNPDYREAAGAILGVEAYHAGSIRTLLANLGAGIAANKITALRATLSGANDEEPLTLQGNSYNFAPTDINALTFRRTPQQVLRIVYGVTSSGVPRGLFFPNGMNGTIRTT